MEAASEASFQRLFLHVLNPSYKYFFISFFLPLSFMKIGRIVSKIFTVLGFIMVAEAWWGGRETCRLFRCDCRDEHRWASDHHDHSSKQEQPPSLCCRGNRLLLPRTLSKDISPKEVIYMSLSCNVFGCVYGIVRLVRLLGGPITGQ